MVIARAHHEAQVLAALDVHTAKHIVEKCFSGELVEGRTIILVVGRHCCPISAMCLIHMHPLDP